MQDVFGLNYDNAMDSSSHSISQVAIGVLTTMTSSLFGSLGTSLFHGYRCASEEEHIHGKPQEEEALELCNLNLDGKLLVGDDLEMPEKINSLQIKEANEDTMLPSGSKNPESFRQFDMVNDCSDHHFVNESGMDLQSPQVRDKNFHYLKYEFVLSNCALVFLYVSGEKRLVEEGSPRMEHFGERSSW